MRPYSPGGALNALATARQGSIPATQSAQRLQLGLPGYLIPFAPLAFAPQRQYRSREPPSPPVFLPISTHFTATLGIPLPSPGLKPCSIFCSSTVELWDFTKDFQGRLRALTPSNSEQRLPPPYYRGCWHGVSRGFLVGYRQYQGVLIQGTFVPSDRSLRPEGLHPPRGVACSGFPPLTKIPHWSPVGVWAVSQSQCGRPPSQAGYRSEPW